MKNYILGKQRLSVFIPTGNFTQKKLQKKENLFAEDFNVNIDSEKKIQYGRWKTNIIRFAKC